VEAKHGNVNAARARAALSAMINWAIREGFDIPGNPVFGTNRPTEPKSRNRVLVDCELAEIWSGCRDDDYGRNAKRYVEEGQRIDTLDAERTLSVLEANLNTFQEQRRSLEREER
jgi:hypothetical protein